MATKTRPAQMLGRIAPRRLSIGERRFAALAILVTGVLSLVTVVLAVTPELRFAVFAPQLDIGLNTVGAVVSIAVATLSFARYREHGGLHSLLGASAFLVLAAASLANVAAIITHLDRIFGMSLTDPGQMPFYFWAAARLLSAGLLAAAAHSPAARRIEEAGRPLLVLWLPTVLLVVACGLLWLGRDMMPVLINEATLRRFADESFSGQPLPGINPGLLLVDGTAALLLLVAALGYARQPRGSAGVPRTYLVLGLLIATFSQIHFIFYPAVFSGLVSTGDVLRVGFYLVLVAGINAGTRADLQELRSANDRLQLLAAAEADRTAMAERARLARELHDGLAQDLWTAKLEFDRLARELDTRDPSATPSLERVRAALEAARREAHDAVGALRSGFDAGLSFADELPRHLDEFIERTGYVVDLELDPRAAELPGVYAAELLRVIDEALHNAYKHADGTRIRVRVTHGDDGFLVVVEDNGRGFTASATTVGHGLVGMRERAALLGGRLEVRSAPGDGTSVLLHLPDASATP